MWESDSYDQQILDVVFSNIGKAVKKALGERKGISRYGSAVIPMDESLCSVAMDLSGGQRWQTAKHAANRAPSTDVLKKTPVLVNPSFVDPSWIDDWPGFRGTISAEKGLGFGRP